MDDVTSVLNLLPRDAVAAYLSIPPAKRRTTSVRAAAQAAKRYGCELSSLMGLLGAAPEAGGMPGAWAMSPSDSDVAMRPKEARMCYEFRQTVEKAAAKARCLADVFKIAETLRKE